MFFSQFASFWTRLLGDRERREEHDHDGLGHGHGDLHEGIRMCHRRNRSEKSGRTTLSVHRYMKQEAKLIFKMENMNCKIF